VGVHCRGNDKPVTERESERSKQIVGNAVRYFGYGIGGCRTNEEEFAPFGECDMVHVRIAGRFIGIYRVPGYRAEGLPRHEGKGCGRTNSFDVEAVFL
jgi:hypothetical protein